MLMLVVVAALGLLLTFAMYDDFQDLLGAHASAVDIFFYFTVKMPSFLVVVLPLGLLISLLYTLGVLHRNNEIVAMRAAGIGLFRITRSLWAAGIVLCGVVWFLNGTVVPWSVEETRALWDTLQFGQEAKQVQASAVGLRTGVAFDNQRDQRMWFFNRYSRYTQRGYGVTVVAMDKERREQTRLLAREAWRDTRKGGWVFRDGREIWTDAQTGEVFRSVEFDEKAFPGWQEDPALMQIFDMKPQDLSFHELQRLIAYFSVEENPKMTIYALRYFGLLADALSPLIIIALAIPFAVAGVRVNPVVGVSKSIGFFLLYFVLVKTSTALGGGTWLTPLSAALVPNLVMLGVGVVLFARVR